MSRIRSRDTLPERVVLNQLERFGYRVEQQHKGLPGTPDITLPRQNLAVFVHGCFWHRHLNCKNCTTPATNRSFWLEKFAKNQLRDRENGRMLKKLGWKVLTIWECETEDPDRLRHVLVKKLACLGATIRRPS
jgi:DNA mismatch endonuclease (patch repair protein)